MMRKEVPPPKVWPVVILVSVIIVLAGLLIWSFL